MTIMIVYLSGDSTIDWVWFSVGSYQGL